jgi:RNA polymerase sigma factor (sigma-70 family)
MSDSQLLERYARGDRDAFAELVRRHVDLVHAAARRQVPGHEDDITQAVFLLLSQRAAGLLGHGSVAGWLFEATRHCARNVLKREYRRKVHEANAASRRDAMDTAQGEEERTALMAKLDEAIGALSAADREAVLLHHLERRPVSEVARALGISEASAAKRTQRAVGKLRDWFARHGGGGGMTLSAVTAVLALEAGHRAPEALAAAAVVIGGKAATVTALAKGAGAGLAVAKAKVAALTVGVAVAAVVIGTATVTLVMPRNAGKAPVPVIAPVALAAVAPPETGEIPEVAAGPIGIDRYDLLLDAPAAAAVRTVLKGEPPAGAYGVSVVNAEELRRVLAQALEAGTLAHGHLNGRLFPNEIDTKFPNEFMRNRIADMASNFDRRERDTSAYLSGQGKFTVTPGKGELAVELSVPNVHATLRIPTMPPEETTRDAKLDGKVSLKAGESLAAFLPMGGLGGQEYSHLVVWQAYSLTGPQQAFITQDTFAWLTLGVGKLRFLAEQAYVWNHTAPAPLGQVGERWTKRTPRGGIVKLAAVSRPHEYLRCTWDPDGNPVNAAWPDIDADFATALAFTVEVTDPGMPDGPGYSDQGAYRQRLHLAHKTTAAAADDTTVEVGLAVGTGKKLGDLEPRIYNNDYQYIEGLECCIMAITVGPPMHMYGWATMQADAEYYPVAVMKDGRHVPGGLEPHPVFRKDLAADLSKQQFAGYWEGLKKGELDHFELWSRPREWVTFQGFAKTPRVKPGDVYTVAGLAKAQKIAELAWLNTAYPAPTRPEAAPDPATPAGTVALVREAARRGDTEACLAYMLRESEDQEVVARAAIDLAIAGEALVQEARRHFEEPYIRAYVLINGTSIFEEWVRGEWQVEGDRATMPGHPGTAMVRRQDGWKFDLRPAIPVTMPPAQREAMLARARQTGQTYRDLTAKLRRNEITDPKVLYEAIQASMTVQSAPPSPGTQPAPATRPG